MLGRYKTNRKGMSRSVTLRHTAASNSGSTGGSPDSGTALSSLVDLDISYGLASRGRWGEENTAGILTLRHGQHQRIHHGHFSIARTRPWRQTEPMSAV